MRTLLVRLYPARWRARYGDEFSAILEERPLGPFDVADILVGALDAQLRLRGRGADPQHARRFTMSLRVGGAAAILGAILFLTGFVLTSIDDREGVEAFPGAAVILTGTALLLLALIGLSSFQARRHPRLIWTAFAVPAIGLTLTGVGIVALVARGDGPLLAGLSPWDVWILGVFATVVGSCLFAIATYRTGAMPRFAAGLLAAGSAVLLGVMIVGMGFVGLPQALAQALVLVGLVGFSAGWVALGWTAIRLDRLASATA